MDAFVIHDHLGHIVSLSFVSTDGQVRGGRLMSHGFSATPIKLPKEINPEDSAAIEALVREYRLDIARGELVPMERYSSE